MHMDNDGDGDYGDGNGNPIQTHIHILHHHHPLTNTTTVNPVQNRHIWHNIHHCSKHVNNDGNGDYGDGNGNPIQNHIHILHHHHPLTNTTTVNPVQNRHIWHNIHHCSKHVNNDGNGDYGDGNENPIQTHIHILHH